MIAIDNTDYNLTLITLEGCEGCSVMFNNVVEAVNKSSKPINLKHIKLAKDTIQHNKEFLAKNNIKDFPTVLFYNKEALKYKYTGSMPVVVILRWIDVHFKRHS